MTKPSRARTGICSSFPPPRARARPRWRACWPTRRSWSSRSRTRPGRRAPGERDGVDYNFVTDDEFARMVERSEFAEWAVVHGNRYGTAIHTVNRALEDGNDYLFDIDWQGGAADPPAVARRQRAGLHPAALDGRAGAPAAPPRHRLRRRPSSAAWPSPSASWSTTANTTILVVNDNLETALKELIAIYIAARCARGRRRALLAGAARGGAARARGSNDRRVPHHD